MKRHDARLRELLKTHDPAEDLAPLSIQERSRMRGVVLAAAQERPRSRVRGLLMVAAAAAAAIFLGIALRGVPRPLEAPPSPRLASSPGLPPAPVIPAARQIQFATPGGTRIVWILNPDLQL